MNAVLCREKCLFIIQYAWILVGSFFLTMEFFLDKETRSPNSIMDFFFQDLKSFFSYLR